MNILETMLLLAGFAAGGTGLVALLQAIKLLKNSHS